MKTSALRISALIFVIAFVSLNPASLVKVLADPASEALSITIDCPSKVYAGDSFVCQVNILNNDSVNHNYLLSWIVDNLSRFNPIPTFNSSGTNGSYETIALTPSFTFAQRGSHYIMLKLNQDGSLIYESSLETAVTIDVIKVDSSFFYQINPNPVYPDSSFSLNLMITNEGDETINYTKITRVSMLPRSLENKTQISTISASLGVILPAHFGSATFPVVVASDMPSGVYSLKVQVEYWDLSDNKYQKTYYIPFEVCSGETQERLSNLELQVENDFSRLRLNLGTLQQSMTAIAIGLLIVTVALAASNYWYARRLLRVRRKVPS